MTEVPLRSGLSNDLLVRGSLMKESRRWLFERSRQPSAINLPATPATPPRSSIAANSIMDELRF